MSDNFEWQTEEDGRWDDELTVSQIRPPRRRPPWLAILVTLGIVAAMVGMARWQVNQQVTAVSADVRADVVAAHHFLLDTAHKQDTDLFVSLISGRDQAWVGVQQTRVTDGLFGNPPFLGWIVVPPELASTAASTATLAPDLRSATVQNLQSYHLLNPQGITETVTLQQTAVYRQGANRWLFAMPEEAFWGGWFVAAGDFVSVTYPRRDEAVALRLQRDLDELVTRICDEINGQPCPSNLFIQLRLETDSTSLLPIDTETQLSQVVMLELPAPSLVGEPVDEASYQALYRAYGVRVATAVITQLTDYTCCHWITLYQSLLDRQLAQLGLKPSPPDQVGYDHLFTEYRIDRMNFLLSDNTAILAHTRIRLQAFAGFLEQNAAAGVSLADMQRLIDEYADFIDWLNEVTGERFAEFGIGAAFWQFVYDHTSSAQVTPSVPYPASGVQLICDGDGTTATVYEYDLTTRLWRTQFSAATESAQWVVINRLPSQPTVHLVMQQYADGSTSHFQMVEDGTVVTEFELPVNEETNSSYYAAGYAPNGRYALMSRWLGEETIPDLAVLDLAACRMDDCSLTPTDRWLIWSPDGSRTLQFNGLPWQVDISQNSNGVELYWGEGDGRPVKRIGAGLNPFWLTNDIYGYFKLDAGGAVSLMTAVAGEDIPRPLLTTDDLSPAGWPPETIFRITAALDQQEPTTLWLFVESAVSANEGVLQTTLFAVELSEMMDTAVNIEMVYGAGNDNSVDFSPHGRWVIFHEYNRDGLPTTLLLDRVTGETEIISKTGQSWGVSWSHDGRWFLLPGDDHIVIGAPEADFQQLIFHDFVGCYQADWLTE